MYHSHIKWSFAEIYSLKIHILGTKVCLHVHGVLPYVIFRVGGDWTENIKSAMKQKIDRLIQKEYPNAGQMANREIFQFLLW